MNADIIFQTSGLLAMFGWAALLVSPITPTVSDRIAAVVVPIVLSVGYAGLILAFWATAEGGFDSLAGVALLFQTRELLLAGWIHYLAFDLFVGAWIVRSARLAAVPFWLVVPCLGLTFLFGPAGFLSFIAIRAVLAPASALATSDPIR